MKESNIWLAILTCQAFWVLVEIIGRFIIRKRFERSNCLLQDYHTKSEAQEARIEQLEASIEILVQEKEAKEQNT